MINISLFGLIFIALIALRISGKERDRKAWGLSIWILCLFLILLGIQELFIVNHAKQLTSTKVTALQWLNALQFLSLFSSFISCVNSMGFSFADGDSIEESDLAYDVTKRAKLEHEYLDLLNKMPDEEKLFSAALALKKDERTQLELKYKSLTNDHIFNVIRSHYEEEAYKGIALLEAYHRGLKLESEHPIFRDFYLLKEKYPQFKTVLKQIHRIPLETIRQEKEYFSALSDKELNQRFALNSQSFGTGRFAICLLEMDKRQFDEQILALKPSLKAKTKASLR